MNEGEFYQRGIFRRDLLQLGSLGLVGLSLPNLLEVTASPTANGKQGRAKSCILIFLEGGPAHQDMWDMKPNAPLEYRGEFQPISSTLTGVPVCEHLPMLSKQMHHLAMVRSVHHNVVTHNPGIYYTLTGRSPVSGGGLIVRDHPENFPAYGSVLTKLRPLKHMPEFVHIPEIMSNQGDDIPGERAGFLGAAYDPLVAGDPSVPGYRIPGLSFPKDVNHQRLSNRRVLLQRINQATGLLKEEPILKGWGEHYNKAFTLLTSSATRKAFDLSQEPQSIRERYGLTARWQRKNSAGCRIWVSAC